VNLVEYLARAAEYLERHAITSPRLNAEVLLANMLGTSRLEIYTQFERQLTTTQADAYRELVVQRGTGRPLQYITGETGFRGLTLEVAEGVFIPRPETEFLVEKALEKAPLVPGTSGAFRVLDLGTGCGCIAVSVASEVESASVVATDCDPKAVELCAANAAKESVGDRVATVTGDVYGPLRATDEFDLIISNPPYIPDGARESLPAEVKDFEPEKALFAGPEGLDVINRIIEGAPGYLAPGGSLVLEVDETHAHAVAETLSVAGWAEVEVFDDLAGKPRVVRAKRVE